MRFRGREMAHQEIGRELLQRVSARSGANIADRAEPAHGRPADGDDVRAEEEIGPNRSGFGPAQEVSNGKAFAPSRCPAPRCLHPTG